MHHYLYNLQNRRSETRSNTERTTLNLQSIANDILERKDNKKMKQWSEHNNMFEKEILFIPIEIVGFHWSLIVVNNKQRSIKYYNTLGVSGLEAMASVKEFVQNEWQKRHKTKKTPEYYEKNVVVPKNLMGLDKGEVTCMVAHQIAKNRDLFFGGKIHGKIQGNLKDGNKKLPRIKVHTTTPNAPFIEEDTKRKNNIIQ